MQKYLVKFNIDQLQNKLSVKYINNLSMKHIYTVLISAFW